MAVCLSGPSSRRRGKPPDQVEPVHHFTGRNPRAVASTERLPRPRGQPGANPDSHPATVTPRSGAMNTFFRVSIVFCCSAFCRRSRVSSSRSALVSSPGPAAQALRTHPQIPRDLRNRLAGGADQRDRVPLELFRIPLRVLTTHLALLPLEPRPSLQVSTIKGKLHFPLPPRLTQQGSPRPLRQTAAPRVSDREEPLKGCDRHRGRPAASCRRCGINPRARHEQGDPLGQGMRQVRPVRQGQETNEAPMLLS